MKPPFIREHSDDRFVYAEGILSWLPRPVKTDFKMTGVRP